MSVIKIKMDREELAEKIEFLEGLKVDCCDGINLCDECYNSTLGGNCKIKWT